MPVRLLSAAERDRLSRFPDELSRENLAAHASLTASDLDAVHRLRGGANRLGLAVQLVALRFLGFAPDDPAAAPSVLVGYLADQLGADPAALADYGARYETVRTHRALAEAHLGFRRATDADLGALEWWLVDRAMEHDRPSLLVSAACDKLKRDRIVRPGLSVVERAVAAARAQAHEETYRRLRPVLSPEVEGVLDDLLVPDEAGEMTTLGWLRRRAAAETPAELVAALEKVAWLRERGVAGWDLTAVGPNRLKMLAGLGRRGYAPPH